MIEQQIETVTNMIYVLNYMRNCINGTFYDVMLTRLQGCGLSESQAEQVMQNVTEANGFDSWQDDVDGYSAILVEALWLGVKREALAWVDANFPKAWYRPMLEG